jgi:two-component system sensor histidine kinase/response regulator
MVADNKFHILVADDNELNLKVVCGLLEHAGYNVTAVRNGAEALETLGTSRFDLVIMDCLMPVMDGFMTTRAIRASDSSRFDAEIPIMAITALATRSNREKCFECGMSDYVAKPVMAQELFVRIARLLQPVPPAAGPAQPASSRREADRPAAQKPGDEASKVFSKILRSMSASVLREARQWQVMLQELSDRQEWEQLVMLAHKIRGTADLLDEPSLSKQAAALETCAKAADRGMAPRLAGELIEGLRRVVQSLEAGS